jgi:hypothetical protein
LYAPLSLAFISDSTEMSALHPRFLPNGIPVTGLLLRVAAIGKLLHSYERFSLGK